MTDSPFGSQDEAGGWGTRTCLFSLSGITTLGPAGWCSSISLRQMPPGSQGQLSTPASERAPNTRAGIHVPSAWVAIAA